MIIEEAASALLSGQGVTCPVPFFGDHRAQLEMEDIEDISAEDISETLRNFLALDDTDRLAATRHVYAYFKDFWDEFEEDALSPGTKPPANPEDVWRLVTPGDLLLSNDPHHEPNRYYIVMEAECDWEPEHGLMLVWRDGKTLTKVSGYDGHVTNRNAYADPAMKNVVYHSYRGFTTSYD